MRRTLIYLMCLSLATPASGQVLDTVATDSGPTPGQKRYVDGLRTASRGVAQLRDGIDRALRTRGDTARHRLASQRLAGLCGTARGFLGRGRAQMSPSVYDDSARVIARHLVLQIDSVAGFLPTCQREAARRGADVAGTLVTRLRAYEAALQRWRALFVPPAQPADSPPP